MPAHNTAPTVGPAIESVLRQTREDFQLVVVDDGSTDDTVARVEPYLDDPRVELVRRENGGAAAARNTGIAWGQAPLVAMIDSDDLYMPEYLERMGAALDADPGAALAYTDAWVLSDTSRRIRRASAMHYQRPPSASPPDSEVFLRLLLERNFIFTSATVRRPVLEEVGGVCERLSAKVDLELWLRIAAAGHRPVMVPGKLAIYRHRAGSITHDELNAAGQRREVWRMVAEEYDVPEDVKEAARAHMRRIDERLGVLGGERRLRSPLLRARRALGRGQRALMWRSIWFAEPPAEVRAAFPDLRAV
jgi:glycosyltransferase involved in cell wall biosynthesis